MDEIGIKTKYGGFVYHEGGIGVYRRIGTGNWNASQIHARFHAVASIQINKISDSIMISNSF